MRFSPRSDARPIVLGLLALTLLLFPLSPAVASPQVVPAYLVNTIDTSRWDPPSPDPAGLAYLPHTGHLFVVDSEVNEIPKHFRGFNMFETTTRGDLVRAMSATSYTNEPTGIAFAADRFDIFISDDDRTRINQIDPGPDRIFGTADDTVGWFSTKAFGCSDPEGVAYGAGRLFITDGVGAEVFVVSPGPNGLFDGVAPTGDDQVSQFDTASLGVRDPEGIEYSPSTGSLYVIGTYKELIETTTEGVLLRTIDLYTIPAVATSDIALAPGSRSPSMTNLYISDRGIDNGSDPEENDGKIYEVTLDRSQLPADMELLGNPGFEFDNNLDGRPDIWIKSTKFSRNAEVVRSGSYSGKISTSNSSFTGGQTVRYLSAGQTYAFSAWVNIPPSKDKFSFTVSVRWLNAADGVISSQTVATHSSPTAGWQGWATDVVAPAGAVSAQIHLYGTSLGLPIYLDDFSFRMASSAPSTTTTTAPPPTTTTTASSTTTTTTTAPPPSTTTTTAATTTTTTASTTTTTAPGPGPELLLNAGFELDANNDGRPDNWTSSSRFTRSQASVRGGLYSGRLYATDNSAYSGGQVVAVTGGQAFSFSGWVNVPPTSDAFSFKLALKFRNSDGLVLTNHTVATFTGATSGWQRVSAEIQGPPSASTLQVHLDVSSLATDLYVDDFSLVAK
jgi:uncharacterized protein YjiK